MPVRGPSRRPLRNLLAAGLSCWLVSGALAGCVPVAPAPAPADLRTTAPPWSAPRDAVSYIEAADLPALSLAAAGGASRLIRLEVVVDATPVTVPAGVGIDALRALQAPAHTHDDSGTITLEGDGADEVTLGQFFTLWGVRYGADCLGAACGSVRVMLDGEPVTDPVAVPLRAGAEIAVSARS